MEQRAEDDRRSFMDQSRGGGTSSRKDPVDAAMDKAFGALLGAAIQQKFGTRQAAPQKPLVIEELHPRLMDEILNLGDDFNVRPKTMLFKGWATDRNGRRTPLEMFVDGTNGKTHFVGRVKWVDHRTVHVIAGALGDGRTAFEEVLAIEQGSSPMGCRFDIVGGGYTGSYKCPDRSGTFYLKDQ